jgi:hypothetical protein
VPLREFGRVNWTDPEPPGVIDPEEEYVEFPTAT